MTLGRGWYWFGAATQSAPATPPTLRVVGTPLEPMPVDQLGSQPTSASLFVVTATNVSGALPATFTLASGTNLVAAVSFRVA